MEVFSFNDNIDMQVKVTWACGSRYSKMDQVKFVEDSLSDRIRPYHFKLFKGYLPQILLGSFLNNLTHIMIMFYLVKIFCYK